MLVFIPSIKIDFSAHLRYLAHSMSGVAQWNSRLTLLDIIGKSMGLLSGRLGRKKTAKTTPKPVATTFSSRDLGYHDIFYFLQDHGEPAAARLMYLNHCYEPEDKEFVIEALERCGFKSSFSSKKKNTDISRAKGEYHKLAQAARDSQYDFNGIWVAFTDDDDCHFYFTNEHDAMWARLTLDQ